MIGVIATEEEVEAVREFFELFKTPWDFYVPGKSYDVILLTKDPQGELLSRLVLAYSSARLELDPDLKVQVSAPADTKELEWNGLMMPIYHELSSLQSNGRPAVAIRGTAGAAGVEIQAGAQRIIRLGYDLFKEVSFLLKSGQPKKYAEIPTLEHHISMIRHFILGSGIRLVEIPPVPPGFDFLVCLTHDVDFLGISRHKLDRTLLGFLYRALALSPVRAFKGAFPWSDVFRNWKAVSLLPLIYANLAQDFWLQLDRYADMDGAAASTFFFAPFKGRPGKAKHVPQSRRRACPYDVIDAEGQTKVLLARGCEIGLHGIDSWHNVESASEELARVSSVAPLPYTGVRMHWLCYDEDSPRVLDEAGFDYDSTFGYNDAVGYRAGTTQAFRPLGTTRLLELPLHIQDTAMFFPDRMGLDQDQAMDACLRLIGNYADYGGVLVVNWHERSLSPERLWDTFYAELLKRLRGHKVCFLTAGAAAKWFRTRRECSFDQDSSSDGRTGLTVKHSGITDGRGISIRVYSPRVSATLLKSGAPHTWPHEDFEMPVNAGAEFSIT